MLKKIKQRNCLIHIPLFRQHVGFWLSRASRKKTFPFRRGTNSSKVTQLKWSLSETVLFSGRLQANKLSSDSQLLFNNELKGCKNQINTCNVIFSNRLNHDLATEWNIINRLAKLLRSQTFSPSYILFDVSLFSEQYNGASASCEGVLTNDREKHQWPTWITAPPSPFHLPRQMLSFQR